MRAATKNGKHGTPASAAVLPTMADQMADQLKNFFSKGQAAQKAVDAAVIAAPFPVSHGAGLVQLDMLEEHPSNPRKVFAGIKELAASIKSTGGLLVPIIARENFDQKVNAKYQVVAGARRLRAMLELSKQNVEWANQVLVDVRQLTDAQVAEAMMAENDDRASLLPLEQAQGYKNMLEAGFTPETIADKLGVSKGTVHGRLKLLDLSPKAKALFLEGVLTTAIATPLGRYPRELQDEALERMLSDQAREGMGQANLWRYGEYNERHKISSTSQKKLNVGMAIAWLQEHFTKSLKTTPWDQEDERLPVPTEVWPERLEQFPANDETKEWVIAPPCKDCPKNSNNMPTEVAGENAHGRSSAGFCTLPPCFDAKWTESLKQMRTDAKEKGKVKVLSAQASRAALNKLTNSDSRYAKASDVNHADSKKRTWGALQDLANENIDEGEQIREVLAISEQGKARLIEKAEVEKVLSAQKVLPKPKKKVSTGDYYAEHKRQHEEMRAKNELRQEIAKDVIERYANHVREKGPTLPMLRLLLELAESQVNSPEQLEQLFDMKSRRELDTFLEKKATANDLVAALYVCMAGGEVRSWNGFSEEVERAAKELKIDLKKREADAIKAKKGQSETTEEGDE